MWARGASGGGKIGAGLKSGRERIGAGARETQMESLLAGYLKRYRDIGRKAVLSDLKTAFTRTPALKVTFVRGLNNSMCRD